ncbi:Uroporphyrinogen decarboxylase in heme biosynthesis [Mycoemilia scoparia]|uniref:Uroporphyrinogen decarboxylase n=1 Tax=Mycoemilia scoparia TaxID=417184 RepID=A0A9W8A544_9FUNG|nr:Uroporphyrinogen decarboxylase in heme biosynthesis [Mycoemilia scoparia]
MPHSVEFPELVNDLYLRAARGEKVERTPVWCMRQAGRYLPEFRAMRAEHNFFKVCRSPELATEVTVQPIDRYEGLLDAAIIFSDILVIPQAMGMDIEMVPGKGPVFGHPLRTPSDIEAFLVDTKPGFSIDVELKYVYDAITMARHRLAGRVPLFGFIGAPWTLLAYMIEGSGSKTFSQAKRWLWKYPKQTHQLLERITNLSIRFLIGQVNAGAQMLQVFDSWAGELGPQDFSTFALPYLKKIAEELKAHCPDVPLTVFAKGAHYALEELAVLPFDVISLDWTIDPVEARKRVQKAREGVEYNAAGRRRPVVLQGNLDPTILFADPEIIRLRTKEMIEKFGSTGHIANLGHGMMPDHDPEHLRVFLESVKDESTKLCCSKNNK